MRIILIIVLLSLFSHTLGQSRFKKDDLRSYCLSKYVSPDVYSFNISPDNQWTLECMNFYETAVADSAKLYIFHKLDTLNKILIMTFNRKSYSVNKFDVDIQDIMVSGLTMGNLFLTQSTWNSSKDTIYVKARNSTINTDSTTWEAFSIDISHITNNKIKQHENKFTTRSIKALNSPNPFRARTQIQYSIPSDNYVAINIYNQKGRLLRVLEQRKRRAGKYKASWDGKDNNGNFLSSGEYYYQVVSGDYITTKKMLMLK